jgi:hypothetical protein
MENRHEEQPQNGRNLRRRGRVPPREEDEERYDGDQGTTSKDSFKYQLGRLREHEQRSSRMYSMDSFKSYGLKQIQGGPLSMIHSGNKESLP